MHGAGYASGVGLSGGYRGPYGGSGSLVIRSTESLGLGLSRRKLWRV